MTDNAQVLYGLIPENGQPIGNVTLKKKFPGDTDIDYFGVRQELLNAGLIKLGKGKGGSVRRTLSETATKE